ncbi:MAG: hypothetical protein AB1491_04285 [Thermodesulfobacteriota bacterium]
MKKNQSAAVFVFIFLLAAFHYGRLFFLQDVFWDDCCWLTNVYASNSLTDFLNNGFRQLRRLPLGTFLYGIFSLHKIFDNYQITFFIWSMVSLLTQGMFALFLYLFVKDYFTDAGFPALLAAICFLSLFIDTTVPIFCNYVYRLGILLMIIAFWLISKGLSTPTRGNYLILLSLIITGCTAYVLMEGAVALEPARFFIISYYFYRQNSAIKSWLTRSIRIFLPFGVLYLPLIYYKLAFKPYAMYGETYKTDFFLLFDPRVYLDFILKLVSSNWLHLVNRLDYTSYWSWGLTLAAMGATWVFFLSRQKAQAGPEYWPSPGRDLTVPEALSRTWRSIRPMFFLGLTALIPPMLLFLIFDKRIPMFGSMSRHGIILEIGYPLLWSSLLCLIFSVLPRIYKRPATSMVVSLILGGVVFKSALFLKYGLPLRLFYSLIVAGLVYFIARLLTRLRATSIAVLLLSLLVGWGVFFNNLLMDCYFTASENKIRFWQTFVQRFPTLPEKADFVLDGMPETPIGICSSAAEYVLEFPLNLLYATSPDPRKFRSYRILTIYNLASMKKFPEAGSDTLFGREWFFGKDVYDTRRFIRLSYHHGKLLVNQEITARYPDVWFNDWGMVKLPEGWVRLPYIYRHKFKGFRD